MKQDKTCNFQGSPLFSERWQSTLFQVVLVFFSSDSTVSCLQQTHIHVLNVLLCVLLSSVISAQLMGMVMYAVQANLAIQEGRLQAAMADLNAAQAQLDEKEAELAEVQAQFDKAMAEKQVRRSQQGVHEFL